jgi:ketosteroid isomerase-like protein
MTDDRLAALEGEIDRLASIEAIRRLVADYSFALDHARVDALRDVFAEDCRVDFGIAPAVDGRAALLELLHEAANSPDPASAFVSTSHHNADLRVDFESPDRARGTVSLYAWHRSSAGSRAEVWGYYFDRYRRTPDGWRIEERVLRACGEDGFPAPWLPIERVAPPERDQDPK